MEFYASIKCTKAELPAFKNPLTISRLPEFCASVTSVLSDKKVRGTIHCLWGEFKINREELKYGVRFSLPDCPNTLSWSVTLDQPSKTALIHLITNKKTLDADFIISIEQFINDWSDGIKISGI
ncbi:hypothetical protein MNBD_GAMMA09-2147 [hydrothermal vent metagenome]|uniref:Uncharacterized protein n=1 Tax=hydrothermal vent metagenome TaxID=652676 RepID=A0A3B0YPR9_9ZZZZ